MTSNSNDAYDIIENTVYYIEEQLHLDHYIEETDRTDQRIIHTVDEWRSRLEEMCALFTKTGKKLLIMLDAADQLTQSEARDELYFIPMNIGANIHFVMTCTPDLKTTGRRCYTLKSIDEAGKRDVIAGTLGRAGRELSKSVIKKMITLKSSDNPLYLSLIVQRLLMMNSADFSEINKAGGSMAAIENYQLKLISENCPDDLDKMSAALLTEAGNRINPALVSKAGQLLAVSRAGLRARDLSVMLGDDWTDIDFAHFISYMNDCFMQRDDGRYDFTHKSIRAGFLRLCPDIDTINKQILTYMKGLPDDDPVRISEIIYHAIRADDKEFFVDYVIDNEYNKSIIGQVSLDTYEKCMSDGGEWIVSVLHWLSSCLFDDGREYDNVSYFANFELMKCFKGSQRELEIQLLILKENVSYAEKLNININNNDTKRSLSVSYERVAGIYEKLGGRENLERALGLYSKGLELAEKLANDLSKKIAVISWSDAGDITTLVSKIIGFIEENKPLHKKLICSDDYSKVFKRVSERLAGSSILNQTEVRDPTKRFYYQLRLESTSYSIMNSIRQWLILNEPVSTDDLINCIVELTGL